MGKYYAVIMAGGSGTRFWPRSRASRPKQFLPLLSEKPLVRETVERLFPLFKPEHVFIVTSKLQAQGITRAAEILPPENIIEEPMGRDTAPCVGLAATFLEWKDPGSTFCTLPADHYIKDIPKFQAGLLKAYDLAQEGRLVTFGVPPSRPETGYGYIQMENGTVKRFCEKPEEARAKEFLAAGNYYWNSGIFVWRAADILAGIERHLPEHFAGLREIRAALGTSHLPMVLTREFQKMKRISIDFGVMEKVEGVAMVDADFGWDDVGSWVAAASHRAKDGQGNVLEGLALAQDTENSIINSEPNHLVAAFGVKDLVVVHTRDATLVCPKDRAADLKKLIDAMKEKGLERFLQ